MRLYPRWFEVVPAIDVAPHVVLAAHFDLPLDLHLAAGVEPPTLDLARRIDPLGLDLALHLDLTLDITRACDSGVAP